MSRIERRPGSWRAALACTRQLGRPVRGITTGTSACGRAAAGDFANGPNLRNLQRRPASPEVLENPRVGSSILSLGTTSARLAALQPADFLARDTGRVAAAFSPGRGRRFRYDDHDWRSATLGIVVVDELAPAGRNSGSATPMKRSDKPRDGRADARSSPVVLALDRE